MEEHYSAIKRGADPLIKVEDVFATMRMTGFEEVELLEWMYEGYWDRYELDSNWKVLAVEYAGIVPLFGEGGAKTRFRLKAKIDLVVEDERGRLWLVDHKTHATLPKDKDLDLDDQFGLYAHVLRQMGRPVFGIIYNTARTKKNIVKTQTLAERFDRYYMTRTDTELDTIAREALATVRTAYNKQANLGERHTNTDTCRWRCPYTEACLMGRKTDDARERGFLRDIGFTQEHERH